MWLSILAVLAGAVPARAGFVDVSATSGVVVNINGTDREDWGFGCAFVDYDNDGDLDLYVATSVGVPNLLYRQESDGTFVDVAADAGVADLRDGRAVKFADYDNDGDQDFFLGNYRAANCLYRNNGDGTFTDVADAAMAAAGSLTFGAAWGDYDNDGWLDLYVVNRRSGRDAGINQLFHNQGDGTFVELGHDLGVDDEKAGLEAVWFDYDNDNDLDLYLSNDKFGGNRLWRNNGDGTFTDVSLECGDGNVTMDSMGIAVGDYDGDGYLDLYLANTPEASGIKNVLLHNNGDGTFTNLATPLGVFGGRYAWGVAFFDYDNDGDLDLYVVNWDLTPGDIAAQNQMFRNNGDGTFTEVATTLGVADRGPGYAVSIGDFDGDGFYDMFVSNNAAQSVLYHNTGGGGRWLKVRTIGTESNRDGIGARVRVVDGIFHTFRDIDGGTGYLSHNQKEACIGVGGVTSIDTVAVRWPSGWTDRFTNVPSNTTLVVREGETEPVQVALVDVHGASNGVHLQWSVNRDVIVVGYRVYRLESGSSGPVTLPVAGVIDKSSHSYTDASSLPLNTEYQYTVAAVLEDDSEVLSEAVTYRTPPPTLGLRQNFPNPFNPGTTIHFDLPAAQRVTLSVYDSAGRRVDTIVDAELGPGPHEYTWLGTAGDGRAVSSGVYFYRLETPTGVLTRKMVRVK